MEIKQLDWFLLVVRMFYLALLPTDALVLYFHDVSFVFMFSLLFTNFPIQTVS